MYVVIAFINHHCSFWFLFSFLVSYAMVSTTVHFIERKMIKHNFFFLLRRVVGWGLNEVHAVGGLQYSISSCNTVIWKALEQAPLTKWSYKSKKQRFIAQFWSRLSSTYFQALLYYFYIIMSQMWSAGRISYFFYERMDAWVCTSVNIADFMTF